MIDGGTHDLHQYLVACVRGRRYIVEHQLPTVFQQSDRFHASSPWVCPVGATHAGASEFRTCRSCWRLISVASNCPCSNAKRIMCDVRSTMGSLVSAPIWLRVAACPVGELRERAAELVFQASDVGAISDALEPLQHQRHIFA